MQARHARLLENTRPAAGAAHCLYTPRPLPASFLRLFQRSTNMQALQQQRASVAGGRVGGSGKQSALTRAAFRPASAGRRNGRLVVKAEKASAGRVGAGGCHHVHRLPRGPIGAWVAQLWRGGPAAGARHPSTSHCAARAAQAPPRLWRAARGMPGACKRNAPGATPIGGGGRRAAARARAATVGAFARTCAQLPPPLLTSPPPCCAPCSLLAGGGH